MYIAHTGPVKLLLDYNIGGAKVVDNFTVVSAHVSDLNQLRKLSPTLRIISDIGGVNIDNAVDDAPSLAKFIESSRIIYPVSNVEDINRLEDIYKNSPTTLMIEIKGEYIGHQLLHQMVHTCLKSSVVKEIVFGSSLQQANVHDPLMYQRVKMLDYLDEIHSFKLHNNKVIHCSGFSGALVEIYNLARVGFITSLITDAAASFARSGLKIDNIDMNPTDYNLEFLNKYHIDDPTIEYDISQIRELITYNMKVMDEYL